MMDARMRDRRSAYALVLITGMLTVLLAVCCCANQPGHPVADQASDTTFVVTEDDVTTEDEERFEHDCDSSPVTVDVDVVSAPGNHAVVVALNTRAEYGGSWPDSGCIMTAVPPRSPVPYLLCVLRT